MENKFGFIRSGKVYAVAYAAIPDREIGEVKSTDEEALAYFLGRFTLLENKVDQVIGKINESNNKGSFLMKLKHLYDTLPEQKALGDFEMLSVKIKKAEESILTDIQHNRKRNLEIKEVLIAELEALIHANDVQSIEALKGIQQRWIKVGKAKEEDEIKLQEMFDQLTNTFFELRQQLKEAKNELYKEREEEYRTLITKARKLSMRNGNTKQDLDALHFEWKKLGKLPYKLTEELWKEFQAATYQFYKQQKQKGYTQNFNAEEQKKTCLMAFKEALSKVNGDASKLVKEYISQWKAIKGKVQKLDDEFYKMVDFEFEKSFFQKIVGKKLEKVNTEEEKKAIALKTLKDLIRRDVDDLQKIEETIGKIHITTEDKKNPFDTRVRLQERKIKAKKQLLEEFNAHAGNFI